MTRLWVHMLDGCFDQVGKRFTLRRHSAGVMGEGAFGKLQDVAAWKAQRPEIIYVARGSDRATIEYRHELFMLMRAELMWRIASRVDATLVVGMHTQGARQKVQYD